MTRDRLIVNFDNNDLIVSIAGHTSQLKIENFKIDENEWKFILGDGISLNKTQIVDYIGKNNLNDYPIMTDDQISIFANQENVFGNVLSNDQDPSNLKLFIANTEVQKGLYGELHLKADGSYQYIVDQNKVIALTPDQKVTDVFTYTGSNGGFESIGQLSIHLAGVNDAPVTLNDHPSLLASENTLTGNVLENDRDPENSQLSLKLLEDQQGLYGVIHFNHDGTYNYTLDSAKVINLGPNQKVQDIFTYEATDGELNTAAKLIIDIIGVNDQPEANIDYLYAVTNEKNIGGNVLENDSDPENNTLKIIVLDGIQQGLYGTLLLNIDGSYKYEIDENKVAPLKEGQQVLDSFSYQVTDGELISESQLQIYLTGVANLVVPDMPTVTVDQATGAFITGKAQPGTTIEVTDAKGDVLGKGITNANGDYLVNLSPEQKNGETVKVTASNQAGTSLPEYADAPDLIVLAPNLIILDSGVSATDNITFANILTVTGLESGAKWEYSLNSGLTWITGTGTTFDVAPDTTYAAGQIQVRQTDKAGNISAAGSKNVSIEFDNSIQSANLYLHQDTGVSSNDNITSNGQIDLVNFDVTDVTSWQYSLTGLSGPWYTGTGTSFILPEGTYNQRDIAVQVFDDAGNQGVELMNASGTIVVDKTALQLGLTFTDTGVSNTDGITYDNNFVIQNLESGATWQYSLDSGSTWTTGVGTGFKAVADTVYAIGQIQVRQTDVAGNTSPVKSNTIRIDIDNSVFGPTLELKSDTGAGVQDSNTSDGTMLLKNMSADNISWNYSLDGGKTWVTGDTSNQFVVPEGIYPQNQIQTQVFEASGFQSMDVYSGNLTVDKTAPQLGINPITSNTITGTSDLPGGQVQVTFGTSPNIVRATVQANGNWSITKPSTAITGDDVTVKLVDIAGNQTTVVTSVAHVATGSSRMIAPMSLQADQINSEPASANNIEVKDSISNEDLIAEDLIGSMAVQGTDSFIGDLLPQPLVQKHDNTQVEYSLWGSVKNQTDIGTLSKFVNHNKTGFKDLADLIGEHIKPTYSNNLDQGKDVNHQTVNQTEDQHYSPQYHDVLLVNKSTHLKFADLLSENELSY